MEINNSNYWKQIYIPPWDLLADKPSRQHFGTSDKFSQDSGFPQRGGCSRTTSSSDLELFRCASVDAQSTMTGGLDPHQQHMLMMRQFPPGTMMNGMVKKIILDFLIKNLKSTFTARQN